MANRNRVAVTIRNQGGAPVDLVNAATNYGAVLENHETTGRVYNNTSGAFRVTGLGTAPSPDVPEESETPEQGINQTSLPARPYR